MDENTRKSATPQPCRFVRFGDGNPSYANWCEAHASFRLKESDGVCDVASFSAVDTATEACCEHPREAHTSGPNVADLCRLCTQRCGVHLHHYRPDAGVNPEPPTKLTHCNWCRDSLHPDPIHHPDGGPKHVPAGAEPASMWSVHTCEGVPTYRCAACWAMAYDPDSAKLTANLFRIGYYESLKRDAECLGPEPHVPGCYGEGK